MLKHRFGFRVVRRGVGARQLGADHTVVAVLRLGWHALAASAAFYNSSAALLPVLPFSCLPHSFFFALLLQEDMLILREDLRDPQRNPTRSNMMQVGARSWRQQCKLLARNLVLLCSLL
jgi:hypothetical protein